MDDQYNLFSEHKDDRPTNEPGPEFTEEEIAEGRKFGCQVWSKVGADGLPKVKPEQPSYYLFLPF